MPTGRTVLVLRLSHLDTREQFGFLGVKLRIAYCADFFEFGELFYSFKYFIFSSRVLLAGLR